jgi:hypothetical protein
MNTRKEYPTFEELWTCCAQEESRISAKEKPQKKYDDQAFTTRFKNFRNKRKFGSRRKPNQEKDIFRSTMLQLSKVWSLQESLSQAKEKEGETRSINCRRKGTYKEDQAGWKRLLLLKVTKLFLFLVHILFASSLYISCISISWKIMCSKKNYTYGRTTR